MREQVRREVHEAHKASGVQIRRDKLSKVAPGGVTGHLSFSWPNTTLVVRMCRRCDKKPNSYFLEPLDTFALLGLPQACCFVPLVAGNTRNTQHKEERREPRDQQRQSLQRQDGGAAAAKIKTFLFFIRSDSARQIR